MLRSTLLASSPGIAHGFATRLGGVSLPPWSSLNTGPGLGDEPANVEENLRRVAGEAGVERVFTVRQVHGRKVIVVGDDSSIESVGALQGDALVTCRPNVAVGVRTADCVPILLADPTAPVVAAIHAGWRGLVAGVVQAAVRCMVDGFGASTDRMLAAIGPAIGACCFVIGDDVAGRLRAVAPGLVSMRGDRSTAALAEAGRVVLVETGVDEEHVDLLRECTCCEAERYFSHRRDSGVTGRQMSYIMLHRPLSEHTKSAAGGPVP